MTFVALMSLGETDQSENDSTGIALGESLEHASSNSVLEACERHFCAQLWYSPKKQLALVGTETRRGDLRLAHYASQDPLVPLSICSVYDERHSTFVCGSALRNSYDEAMGHATEEAIMLHDSLLRNEIPRYSSDQRNNHFVSLRDVEQSKKRREHLNSLLQTQSYVTPPDRSSQDIARLVSRDNKIKIACLARIENNWVVKAIVPGAEKPAQFRNGATISDPFC